MRLVEHAMKLETLPNPGEAGEWDHWALAVEMAILAGTKDNMKRWVFKGPDGKWWVR